MEDQHFMTDQKIIGKIIQAARPRPGETILEIGAGHGELTGLLARTCRVIAIEKDLQLFRSLKKKLEKEKNATLIHGNALEHIPQLKFDKIVSNLPYSLCEPLFQKLPFLEFHAAFLTLPQKFFERLLLPPYSCWFETQPLFPIPKAAFSPPPRTSSVFLKISPRKTLLGIALLQRESKLKNALQKALVSWEGMTKRQAKEALKDIKTTTFIEKRVMDIGLKELETLERILSEKNFPKKSNL